MAKDTKTMAYYRVDAALGHQRERGIKVHVLGTGNNFACNKQQLTREVINFKFFAAFFHSSPPHSPVLWMNFPSSPLQFAALCLNLLRSLHHQFLSPLMSLISTYQRR
jgi:hypothetical protein